MGARKTKIMAESDFLFDAVDPQEAIEHFEAKGYAIGFSWRDVWQEEHARAFTVAKAMSIDILEDIRDAVDEAIAHGMAFEDFVDQLEPILQSKGWWGRKPMVDPITGEEREVQLGSIPRLDIIYDTNLRTSYSAGRWKQIEETRESLPYLRYVDPSANPRPQHLEWSGTVLPIDDPWWDTHYPPGGFNCHCYVDQLSNADLTRRGYKLSAPGGPPGEADEGWNYNVGKAGLQYAAEREIEEKIAATDVDIAAAIHRRWK